MTDGAEARSIDTPDQTRDPEQMREVVRSIQQKLAAAPTKELLEFCSTIHPSDLADIIEHLEEEERLKLLDLLPAPIASDALAEMEEEEHAAELLVQMEPGRIAELVEELADDDAADLIGELEPEEQERVLGKLAREEAEEIRDLLHYPDDSAGGIMTHDLLAVSSDATAGEAIEHIRERGADQEDLYSIFVVDPDDRLRGVVPLQRLVLASTWQPIAELVEDAAAVVPVDMDQEEVANLLSRYNLVAIGVVDGEGRLLGRITFDDVIDVVESETTEDILRFAATSEEEMIRGGTLEAVRSRLPWLGINFFTISAAGAVVWLFQDVIEQAVILAVIMPVIAGLGGNAGTQALAVTIRRIALSDETVGERWTVVTKELRVGIINGLAIGLVVAAAAYLIESDLRLGLVVMIAMWGNLIVASTAGAFFPILLESLGIDPAVASSIFVTTFTDLLGFLLLLGLAATVLL